MIYNDLYDLEGFIRINTLNDLKTKNFNLKENDIVFVVENFTFYKVKINDNVINNDVLKINTKLKCEKLLTAIDEKKVINKIEELNNKKSDEIDLANSDNLATSMAVKKINDIVNTKEAKIIKKTAFNLDKTDNFNLDDTNLLGTAKALKALYDELNRKIDILDLCPYKIGDVYVTTKIDNPANIWSGTGWQKIEGRFLKATNSGENPKTMGGSNAKTLSVANLPSHNHSVWIGENGYHTHTQDAHAHTQPAHTHPLRGDRERFPYGGSGKDVQNVEGNHNSVAGTSYPAGGENTGVAQPGIYGNGNHTHSASIGNTGSGSAFDVTPAYYAVNMWLRIS